MTPILLLAEARGEAEERLKSTLIGPSGVELLRMLGEAEVITLTPADRANISKFYATRNSHLLERVWANHPEVYRTNVFNIHPPANNLGYFLGDRGSAVPGYPSLKVSLKKGERPAGTFVRLQFASELERLGDEILHHNPNLIIALGNVALWALTGLCAITKVRGTTCLSTHTVTGYKVLPTFHPAAILRNYDNRPTVVADLMKAHNESAHPQIIRPPREFWVEPTLDDIETFIRAHVRGCRLLSVDIETSGQQVTCIGLAPDSYRAIIIPFTDPRAASRSYWPTLRDEVKAWGLIREVLSDPTIPKLFQNGVYDITFLWRSLRVKTYGALHDTMLLHHALHPESTKGLGFLGSIYSNERTWKGMRHEKTTKRDD